MFHKINKISCGGTMFLEGRKAKLGGDKSSFEKGLEQTWDGGEWGQNLNQI